MTTAEHAELVALRKQVRELKTELMTHRRATELPNGTLAQKARSSLGMLTPAGFELPPEHRTAA